MAEIVGGFGVPHNPHFSRMGANHFLLHQLGRRRVLGLDLPTYAERIRAAWR